MALICWNTQFQEFSTSATKLTRVGAPMSEIVRPSGPRRRRRGTDADRVHRMAVSHEEYRERFT